MINGYDIAYGLGLGISAPVWLAMPRARRKVFNALRQRMGRGLPRRDPSRPAILIHAVSAGEINSTPALLRELRARRPELQFIVTTTTDVGFDAGMRHFGHDPDVMLVRYPLDFTPAVDRLLAATNPSAAVLMELEVWPNFLRQCRRRKIPVILANGRITDESARRYRRIAPIAAAMFRQLTALCVQDPIYADRFRRLRAPAQRLHTVGTMKFDSAAVADRIDGDAELASAVGLNPGTEPIWVCGSTGPGEESIVLTVYAKLRQCHPDLRLVIVPRQPARFDEVAEMILASGFALRRRSKPLIAPAKNGVAVSSVPDAKLPVILGDTMGELRLFYSLATVVFVGRSLVDLGPRQHGSNMIEAAALAKPVVVGPFTGNFAEPMNRFRAAGAVVEADSPEALSRILDGWLTDPAAAARLGHTARQVVIDQQGATARHAEIIVEILNQEIAPFQG